jgi:hypothetical protein
VLIDRTQKAQMVFKTGPLRPSAPGRGIGPCLEKLFRIPFFAFKTCAEKPSHAEKSIRYVSLDDPHLNAAQAQTALSHSLATPENSPLRVLNFGKSKAESGGVLTVIWNVELVLLVMQELHAFI